MPVLRRQVLISTELDLHGERLSRHELWGLFSSLPKTIVLCDQHDLASESPGKAENLDVAQLDSGEWAIVADVTIDDAATLTRRGGFSMSWMTDAYTLHPDRAADVLILFNPRLFHREFGISFTGLSNERTNIVARELKQKGFELETAVLVVKFLTAAYLAGFVGKAGADHYDKLCKKLSSLRSGLINQAQPAAVQFLVPRHLNALDADVMVEVPEALVDNLRSGSLSFEDAMRIAERVPYATTAKKIVVRTTGNPPHWQLSHYEKESGVMVRIKQEAGFE